MLLRHPSLLLRPLAADMAGQAIKSDDAGLHLGHKG